ncbi:MAG: DNA pilot protein [Microvirus sp.]|nr:MAG: DNA pilot protein [Microvirus sp.]
MGLFAALGSLIHPVVGAIGGAIDARNAQKSTNDFNSAQALAQQDFQERMSSTSWQRGVKDMEAAGLNPMLAYSQGGASSPGGAMATMQNMHPAEVASAAADKQANSAVALQKAQIDKTHAETDNVRADTLVKETQVPLNQQYTATSAADASLKGEQIRVARATVDKVAEEIRNIYQDTFLKTRQGDLVEAQTQVARHTVDRILAETKNLGLTSAQITALTMKTLSEADLVGLDVKAAMTFDNLGRNVGQAKPLVDIVKEVVRSRRR